MSVTPSKILVTITPFENVSHNLLSTASKNVSHNVNHNFSQTETSFENVSHNTSLKVKISASEARHQN